MRLLRIASVVGILVVAVCIATAVVVSRNQERLLRFVLAKVKADSGYTIAPESGRIALRTHLVVTLEHPRLLAGNREIARAARLRVLVSYHALIFFGGLPFAALICERPQLSLAAAPVALVGPPRLDAAAVELMRQALDRVATLTRKLVIIGGSLTDARAAPLVDHVDLTATLRKHLRISPWRVRFVLECAAGPLSGSEWAGDLRIKSPWGRKSTPAARGELWAWNIAADRLGFSTIAAPQIQSSVIFTLLDEGRATGSLALEAKGVTLQGKPPLALGDFSAHAAFEAAGAGVGFKDITLLHGSTPILAGQCVLDQAKSRLSVLLSGLKLDLASLRRFLAVSPAGLPSWAVALADRIGSGTVRFDQLGFDSTLEELRTPSAALLRWLSLDAQVSGLNAELPPELGLPRLSDLSAQVSYVHGLLVMRQGTLRVGSSSVSDFSVRADFSRQFANASYELRARGDADLAQLYPLLGRAAPAIQPDRWLKAARGSVAFELSASGRWSANGIPAPAVYSGRITPRGVELALKRPAQTVTVTGGNLSFTPAGVQLSQLKLDLKPGTVLLNGGIEPGTAGFGLRDLRVELEKIPAERWLPLAVSPDDFAARGPIAGRLVLNAGPTKPAKYAVNGSLTMAPGEISLGFVRSPLTAAIVTATFAGHNLTVSMPAATLEGHLVDLKLTVTHLRHPALRIDAVAQQLDLEAVKFVRLPWSPKRPVSFLHGANASGHIEVVKGNLAKLPLSNLKTDFVRTGGQWRVYNLRADSLDGLIEMQIAGRERDDWIEMKGRVAAMDAGALFSLSGESPPPLQGRLYGDFDLWADTDTDFFETLAGKASAVLKDGKLEKFTLLSRLLGLIDLKNWLSAQVPDPRATGLPFRIVSGDFTGSDGVFYTRNLVLDGPVMDITAEGDIDVADNSLAMDIGMLPFQTVNWLVNMIPIIGEQLSQGSRIFAAYFRVEGPVRNPRITPEPITSAAEIVKRTLGLPINLLRPNTVK